MTTHAQKSARRPLTLAWRLVERAIAGYGLLGLGYVLARLAVGERWRPVAFANNFVPWWTLAALGAALLALPSRRRWWLIPLQLPLLIAFVVVYGDRFAPQRATDAADADAATLRVMTYNLQTRATSAANLEAVLRDLQPDVVGLEEFHRDHLPALDALQDLYPYQAVHLSKRRVGLALLSRYPIAAQGAVDPAERYPHSIRVEVEVGGAPVAVYLVHPDTPDHHYFPWAYDDTTRDAQLGEARDAIAAEQGPVLMLCDCNMSDQSDAYRAFDRLLTDSYREAGRGLGLTFPARFGQLSPSPLPLLRLDYIWHSDHFAARAARVMREQGTSDHFAVIAELVLEQRSATDD